MLDIGCGDGRFSIWMQDELDCKVFGTDPFRWPKIWEQIKFMRLAAESVDEAWSIKDWEPDIALFMDSLTFVSDWKKAIGAATRVATTVVVFDNFSNGRITLPDLVWNFAGLGFDGTLFTSDVIDRKLLRMTPPFLHPLMAYQTIVLDRIAAAVVNPYRATHVLAVFRATVGKLAGDAFERLQEDRPSQAYVGDLAD